MPLPAIAALIARMTAGRAGVAVLSELLGSRAGAAAITRTAGAAATEESAAATAVRREVQYKSAEEMLKRPRPQAPAGGIDVGGKYYKAGRFIPTASVQAALQQSGANGPYLTGPGGVMFSRPGPPPIQAPPVQSGGAPGSSPGQAGRDATEATDKLLTGAQKLMLVVSPAAALGVVLAKTPNAAEKFGRSLLDAEVPLRRFNGRINAAFAELDRGDLMRMKGRADATSGSTATLAKAMDQLGEDTKDLQKAGTTILNLVAIGVVYIGRCVAFVIKLNPVVQKLMEWLKMTEEKLEALNPVGPTWHNFVNDLARGQFTGKHNRNRGGKP